MGAEETQEEPQRAVETAQGGGAPWCIGGDRFEVLGRLGAGGMGVVYEALDRERGVRVALKTLHTTNPQTLYRFKQEFRALAEITHPRLVRLFELVADRERWFFTMERVDGVGLLDWLRRETAANDSGLRRGPRSASALPRSLVETSLLHRDHSVELAHEPLAAADVLDALLDEGAGFLAPDYERLQRTFAQLAEGVHVLHMAGRLHRDLKPENVFVRSATAEVVLLDFGLVGALEPSKESGRAATARLSHAPANDASVELRSEEVGQSGVVHAYHATQAGLIAGTFAYMAPEQALAQPLTAAADWYAVGVMLYEALTGTLPHDGDGAHGLLQKQMSYPAPPSLRVPGTPETLSRLCMDLLRREPSERPQGSEVVARLGGSIDLVDASDLSARAVFVGREAQLCALQAAHESAASNLTIANVHGRSGAGKSSLLQRFLGELAARPDTLVIAGRCYEQEFIPFKAMDSLMDALTRHLLQLSPPERVALLPRDGRVLSRVFPVLGRLFPAEERGAAGADHHAVRRQAFEAMRELLHGLSRRSRLVLFIDDLQWGDVDSAALLAEVLRAPDAPRLLLVLAYRDEQREANAGLRAIMHACKAACPAERLFDIAVDALAQGDAELLARRLLGASSPPWALPWVLEQAAGSAFLIHELARDLQAGSAPHGEPRRSLDQILWERVRLLPGDSRALLAVVAVAGRPTRLRHVQRAAELAALPPTVVATLCRERLLRTEGTGPSTELETFHDRVRESILSHTPAAQLAQHALSLVRVLEQADEGDVETRAALFERAGEPGRASSSYADAVAHAVASLAFEHAERLAHKAITLARTDEERARAYEVAIHYYTDMARFAEAYALTRAGVATLGVDLPQTFKPPLLIADLLVVQASLWGREPSDLLALPTMPEGRLRLAVRLANAGAKAAFQLRPELCVAVCTKIVRLCLAHGNTPDCAVGYMVFGAIFQGGILGRYPTGHALGQLALALVDKYQNERQRAEVSFVVGYFGTSWLRPAREAEALFDTAYEAGRASGDLFHMGCSAAGRMMSLSMRGAPLAELERESGELCRVLAQKGLREHLAVVASARQLARDLRGHTSARGSWQDAEYDEPRESAAWSSLGARHFAHCCLLLRAQSYCLWGKTGEAEHVLGTAAALASDSKGMLHSAEHVFLAAMVAAVRAPTSVGAALAVAYAARQLRAWAGRCPDNFLAKAELVRGEALRMSGFSRASLRAYQAAVQAARRTGHVHVEGWAHGLQARLHGALAEQPERARELEHARACFVRWGAGALAQDVELLF